MPHVADVTIQSSQVDADLTDFVFLIDLSDLPTVGFWDTVANGGGDIRVYKSDGTTQLAREVVSCDTATDTGKLYGKFSGVLSSSSNTVVQIWTDEGTEPAVTATYGRNAVWPDYERVYHLSESSGDFVDSTGSGNDGTATGTVTRSATVGNFTGVDLGAVSGHSNYVDAATLGLSANSSTTTTMWCNIDVSQNNWVGLVGDGGNTAAANYYWQRRAAEANFVYYRAQNSSYTGISGFSSLAGGGATFFAGVHSTGAFARAFLDGVQAGNQTTVSAFTDPGTEPSPTLKIGNERTGGGGTSGSFAALKITTLIRSNNWISTEYNNQSSPSTFYTATAVGGGTVTVSIGIASDTTSALSISTVAPITASIGVASDTSSALTISPIQSVVAQIGIASDTSTALPVSATSDVISLVGLAVETDTALSISPIKDINVAVGLASETDSAQSITATSAKVVSIGVASESTSPLPVTIIKTIYVELGVATEVDIPLDMVASGPIVLAVSCRLVDVNGNALPNLDSLSYAWFDESDPADFSSPVVQGAVETTDASGNIEVPLPGTSLSAGGVGTLILRSDSGVLFGAYNLEAA